MTSLFVFGTLRDDALRAVVLGGPSIATPATCPDHEASRAADEVFPILNPSPGATAPGLLLTDLSAAARARLDFYESVFDYTRHPILIEMGGVPVETEVYLPPQDRWHPAEPWDLTTWQRDHSALECAAAKEILARQTPESGQSLAHLAPFFRARAWSQHLARAHPAPTTIRHTTGPGDIAIQRDDTPFNGFFRLKSFAISGREFQGNMGPVVDRECFVSFDAALVLPYDPQTDRVLLVEQLRFGPLWRGDPEPWTLEPVAGLVDAGETPETAARREAAEEAGLALDELLPITGAYPAPGYVTEFYHCFVGLTALDASDAGIGGLVSESENIRSHVLAFDDAMALVDSGEINALPLVMMLLWLDRQRPNLRRF